MIPLFRFSPSRLALVYVALSMLVLAMFAVPLWYVWRVNYSTLRTYVRGDDVQRMVEIFERHGPQALATAIEARVRTQPGDDIVVFADPAKVRLAGNLPGWPPKVPATPGTSGLVIDRGGSSLRVVASHVRLPGGYHLLVGRESARFQSLVDLFWYGIAGAVGVVLVLGAAAGWMIRRALLSEVREIDRTAAGIVQGDLSSRVAVRGESAELDTLARTVNGMLERLARQNVMLEGEITVRRQAEAALHRAHADLENLVTQRTAELARANESLRGSELKLEEAQRIAHVGHWEHDLATDRYTWSDETYRIFGLAPQESTLGFGELQALVHPADRPLREAAIAQARQRGRYDLEYRAIRPSGEVRFVHAQADVLRDESGRVHRLFGTIQDITERKRAERRLVLQHDVTCLLAEAVSLPDATPGVLRAVCDGLGWELGALWTVDRRAGLLRCVEIWHHASVEVPLFQAASRAMSFARGVGLPGRVWASRAPAWVPDVVEDANFARAAIAAQEGLHGAFGFPILLGDDVLGCIEFFSHEIRQPDQDLLDMMTAIGSQIGQFIERKRAEEALRASEASLAEAQQMSHTGSWRWNLRTGEVRGSAEHSRIFGFPPNADPRPHARYRERVHPEDRPALEHLFELATREQTAFQHEYRLALPDGGIKHVQAVVHPQVDASGEREFVGTMIDVTERKRAEEALREAQGELARVARLTTMGELTTSIAHEINQPLGAIVNNAGACVRWLAAQKLDEARASATQVIEDGHRAAQIVGRIRALAEKAPPERDWLDLNATIRHVMGLARGEVHRNGVVLETRLAEDVPPLQGDSVQLQQVVLNLVVNAVEAMSAVGTQPRRLVVSSQVARAREVVVAIQDSGPGFDSRAGDRLFDAFYTTKPRGLGLGLAISRRIVEAHGGRLWATANAPQGAVFQFALPVDGAGMP